MAQQALEHEERQPRFHPVRRKGMAQTVDAPFVRQTRPRHRLVEDLLAGPVGHGLLRVAGAGEEPAALGVVHPPVSFQLPE